MRLLGTLALALCALALTAAPALAADPTATLDSTSAITETSVHLEGTIETEGLTYWRFDYSTDGVNWVEDAPNAHGGPIEPAGPVSETVSGDFEGLQPNTRYYARFAIYVEGFGEVRSSTRRFTTAATPGVQAPTVISIADASSVSIVTAKASGEVERPLGIDPALDTRCHFEFASEAQFVFGGFESATSIPCEPENPVTSTGPLPVHATLSGLNAATTYHLRLIAENAGGTDQKVAADTFTTEATTAPTLAIDPATGVLSSKAHISGTIDPEGGNVDANAGPLPIAWELQINREGAGWEPAEAGTIEGAQAESTDPITVAKDLENLAPDSEYQFRLRVTYVDQEAISSEGSFETEGVLAPSVSSLAVSALAGTSAHFSAKVDPNGADPLFNTAWHFQCAPSCGEPGGTVVADGSEHTVEADVSGLEPNTGYEVELLASNQGGADEEGPRAFATTKVAPGAQTGFAEDLEDDAATLVGKVNPHNSEVTYQFEYGPDESYGSKAPVPGASLGTIDNSNHEVTQAIEGLQEGTTYHFRLAATNTESDETSYGEDHTFQTGPAAACPNEQLRAENSSLGLPGCRAYELVSAIKKNGNEAGANDGRAGYAYATASGSGILYGVTGAQGNAHRGIQQSAIGFRTATGWTSEAAIPSGSPERIFALSYTPFAITPADDLSKILFVAAGSYVPDNPQTVSSSAGIYVGHADGAVDWLSRPQAPYPGYPLPGEIASRSYFEPVGASPDLSTVYFSSGPALLPSDASTRAPNFDPNNQEHQAWGLYEWSNGVLKNAGTLPPTALHPEGVIPPEGAAPAASSQQTRLNDNLATPDAFANQVSRDGSTLWFVSRDPGTAPPEADPGIQLYVRRNGQSTLVSHLPNGDMAPDGVSAVRSRNAYDLRSWNFTYAYASPDGNTAIFQSHSALTPDAPNDGSKKAYRYNVETDTVTYLPGVGGGSVVATSDDGARFLFADAGGIYVWDNSTAKVIYRGIASVLAPARATASGSAFVFVTAAQIPGFNNSGLNVAQVYRYDVAQDKLSCLSCPPDAVTPSDSAVLSRQDYFGVFPTGEMKGSRSISTDGKVVFFDSPDPLVPQDTNGVTDVYEWTPGGLSLISSGLNSAPSYFLDNSADGNDVFIATKEGLDPRDTDSGYDVYDARVGGGFPQAAAVSPCSEDNTCKEATSPPPTDPGSATEAFSGPGNPSPCPKGKVRRHGRCVKQKQRKHKHHKRAHKKNNRTAGHGRGGST